MFILLFTTTSIILSSLILLDAHLIIYNTIENNINKIKRLNNASKEVIKIKNKNQETKITKFKIIKVTLETIFQKLYLSLSQYMFKSVKIIKMGIYEVNYLIGGKTYKIIINSYKGPCPILQIYNENYEDITNIVLPYMGPNYDWHGNKFNPEFFGCNIIYFELCNGESYVYKNDEHITHKC